MTPHHFFGHWLKMGSMNIYLGVRPLLNLWRSSFGFILLLWTNLNSEMIFYNRTMVQFEWDSWIDGLRQQWVLLWWSAGYQCWLSRQFTCRVSLINIGSSISTINIILIHFQCNHYPVTLNIESKQSESFFYSDMFGEATPPPPHWITIIPITQNICRHQ